MSIFSLKPFQILRKFWTSSVARQLILGIALVHAVLMSIFVFDLGNRERDFMIKENQKIAVGLAETLATNGTAWMLSNDVIGMEEIIASQSNFPAIQYAMFVDRQGKILAYTNREQVGMYLSDKVSKKIFKLQENSQVLYEDNAIIDVASPVIVNNKLIGWARVGLGREEITRNINYVTKTGLFYTLVAISIGILFAWLMARGLTTGIRKLTRSLEQVIDGDRHVSCYLDRHDELGKLSIDFTRMLQTLNERDRQLIKTHGALEKTEARFKRLIENLKPDYIFYTHNDKGEFTYISPSIKEVLGYSVEEYMGTYDRYYVNNDINIKAREYTSRILQGEEIPAYEVYVEHKEGGVRVFEITESPVFDETGHVISVEGLAHDVTQQKESQRQLIEEKYKVDREQALLSSLIDSMPDIVYYKNILGQFLGCNRAFESFSGILETDLIGKSYEELPPNALFEKIVRDENISIHERRTVLEEIDYIQSKNHQLTFDVLTAPYTDSEYQVLGVIGIVRDITEQKQKEMQLNRSQKLEALGKLTGGIAHDYNNILGIIIGYAELMALTLDESDERSRYIREIKKAGERGANLAKKLLSITKREGSNAVASDLNAILKNDREMLEKTMTARINVHLQLEDNLGFIQSDEADLQDAILNMSINAMHAMPNGGNLAFKTENIDLRKDDADALGIAAGEYVRLTVSDDGIGMDDEIVEKIFDPFFTTKGEMGTGLGLSQVFGLVKRCDGGVSVHSAPDKGTTFELYFRRVNIDNPELLSIETLSGRNNDAVSNDDNHNAKTILLVDDEPSLQMLGREILEDAGYQVYLADDAKQALEILNRVKADFLISDIIMPDIDGFKLAEEVSDKYPAIKILLVSGYNEQMNEDENKSRFSMLQKPYRAVELLDAINKLGKK